MPGRGFLDVARDFAGGPTEYHQRAAVVNAYYALVLECRDALFRWGIAMPPRDKMHAWVRLRFTYAGDADLRFIGFTLDDMVKDRNKASYDLQAPQFGTPAIALNAIKKATTALARLGQIDADPARRAAAIASIKP